MEGIFKELKDSRMPWRRIFSPILKYPIKLFISLYLSNSLLSFLGSYFIVHNRKYVGEVS